MKEIRKDIFTGQWVVFNTDLKERMVNFWLKREFNVPKLATCSFCEGKENETPPETLAYRRSGTIPNGPGWWIRTFKNKDSALIPDEELDRRPVGIYDMVTGYGVQEIIVETPEHRTQLEELPFNQVRDVLWSFKERISSLKANKGFKYVLVFKNFGLGTFGSMEHSHSQILATPIMPRKIKDELIQAKLYYSDKERCIFCDVIKQEIRQKERVIYETEHFVVIAPYASNSPYEMFIFPRVHSALYEDITPTLANDLTDTLIITLKKLSKVLSAPPYTLVIHTAPNFVPRPGYWGTVQYDYHWHIEISPRLFRLSGLEWGTGFFFNPIMPEEASIELKNISV
ncbi:MAG: galactose-1-phosphate uridylyltransferase [Proteobacteria bacterium]|nr:galactose-1-phosphate uridylyltransferase [Pseudomonadota bacterium]